jgi:hypothetical protein
MAPAELTDPLAKLVSYLSVDDGKSALGFVTVKAPELSHHTPTEDVVKGVGVEAPSCKHTREGAPEAATAPE